MCGVEGVFTLSSIALKPPNLFLLVEFMGVGKRLFLGIGYVLEVIFFHSHTRNMHLAPSRFGGTWVKYLFQSLCTVLIPDGSRPAL